MSLPDECRFVPASLSQVARMALAPDGPLDGSAAIKVAAEVLGKVLAESEETLRWGAARAAEEALAEVTTFTNK
eukprot:708657-Prorocentrum_minimum.AAC.1